MMGEIWQEWWKSQEKLFDVWKETASQFQPDKVTELFGDKGKDLWQDWWKSQGNLFNTWMDSMSGFQPNKPQELFDPKRWGFPEKTGQLYQDWYKMTTESIGEFMKWAPAGVGKETFDKVLQGSDLYMKLFSFWTDYASKMQAPQDTEKWKDLSRTWMTNYHKVLDSFFSSSLPEPYQKLFKNTAETTEIFHKTFFNFFQPWLDSSPELKEKALGIFKGDREAYTDFLRAWWEVYQQTYGKVLRVPAFGLSRESFEKLLGGMDSYIQYMAAVNEFSAALYKIGYDAMDGLSRKVSELYAEGKAPRSFKEFYQLWWRANEDAYSELFKTEGFARLQGEVVDAQLRFKKRYDQWLEELFGKLPIPTNNEMDSLYKTVYDLKKMLKEQGRKLEKLGDKMEALSRKGVE